MDTFFNYLSSAEVMTRDTGVLPTPLPRAGQAGPRAGGRYEDSNGRDEVIARLDEEQEWVDEGRMVIARSALVGFSI